MHSECLDARRVCSHEDFHSWLTAGLVPCSVPVHINSCYHRNDRYKDRMVNCIWKEIVSTFRVLYIQPIFPLYWTEKVKLFMLAASILATAKHVFLIICTSKTWDWTWKLHMIMRCSLLVLRQSLNNVKDWRFKRSSGMRDQMSWGLHTWAELLWRHPAAGSQSNLLQIWAWRINKLVSLCVLQWIFSVIRSRLEIALHMVAFAWLLWLFTAPSACSDWMVAHGISG